MKIRETIFNYIAQVIIISFKIILGLFFPIICCCIVLNLLSKEQNRRLYEIGGWRALLATAWIGTPIHELSHFLVALIANHRIIAVKLFKPDPQTGSMGYVHHGYKDDNFYQAVIGNTLIAIAPFFGGSAVIYLISSFIFPDFSLFGPDVPQIHYLNIDNALEWRSYLLFATSAYEFFDHLASVIFSADMLRDWKLYLFLFLMLGIANHLSPSASDFQNLWYPLAIFLASLVLLNMITYPLVKNPEVIISAASRYIFVFLPILYLAIFISALGLIITYILSAIVWLFRR